MQKYLHFVRHNNREAVAYIALLLDGYAASWYDQRYIKAKVPAPKSPQLLLKAIVEKFESPLALTDAWLKWIGMS